MDYQVIPEEKIVCVWSNEAPKEDIDRYRSQGYRVAYFIRGDRPVRDVLKSIILSRC